MAEYSQHSGVSSVSVTPQVTAPVKEQFRLKFKRYFLAGLAALLPIILTLFIVVQIYRWIVPYIVAALGSVITLFVGKLAPQEPVPGEALIVTIVRKWAAILLASAAAQTVLSILLAVVIVYIVGYAVSSYVGRMAFDTLDDILKRFPVIKVIYPYAKQFTDSFFRSDKTAKFNKVVAVQYPRPGIYSLGFLVGSGVQELSGKAGKRMVTVFVPSSPTPVMGYVIIVPEEDVIPLNLSVDEVFRMVISLGILSPTGKASEQPPTALSCPHSSGTTPP